jgi:BirA family transcriptional regulator, biotin operon repressor / biotin---[acetyl-CoA-carboxylase] ligase
VDKNPARTLFLGKRLEYVPECHSTNDIASKLSRDTGIIEGTVVITDKQTAGKGQQGNSWESEPGKNLTFSLVLKPGFLQVNQQYQLNKAIALGIRDALKEISEKEIKIKWPNDIMAAGKKLCGILIENNIGSNSIQQSIVGIGLNVNQTKFDIPRAGSLKLLMHLDFDLNTLLELLLLSIEVRYLQLRAKQTDKIDADYLNALQGLNESLSFISGDEVFEGIIRGIDENGKLLVEVNASMRAFAVKEITYL